MNRPTFIEGVAVAIGISLAGSILYTALTSLLPGSEILQPLIAGMGFTYVLYLFKRTPERVGRVVTLVGWSIAAAIGWFVSMPLTLYLLLHVGLIWLIRSLYFHSSLLPAMADLGLNTLALAAAFWAVVQSESLFLALWCFFLVQALFVSIPPNLKQSNGEKQAQKNRDDHFLHAHRIAEAAVRKLSSIR